MLKSATGNLRYVMSGVPYYLQLGETPIGAITEAQKESQEPLNVMTQSGVQWGDAVAWATKKFGIQPCSACEKRRKVLNAIKQIGIVEAVKQIKETL